MSAALDAIRAAVARGAEADDVLRSAVSALAAADGVAWAGIAFVEGEQLVLGPQAGSLDPARRLSAPVLYRDVAVAELRVDGDIGPDELRAVAAEVAEQCLVGWDTGGEPWAAG